ncbi:MAG: cytochrome c biogenesis CcdA family protein [Beijerinckiaceae bacterium]
MGTVGFAFLAGVLTILSPCVLPLVPMVLAAAAGEHRFGPLALAGGLAISFTIIGLFVALFGFALGLDAEVFRVAAAVLMIVIGAVLLLPAAQTRFAAAAGPVADWTEQRFGGFSTAGLGGQFAVGLLLGAVWAPCVGPTLGAASLMASRGENLGMVSLTMLVFGVGAALPLVLLGFLSRETMMRWRGKLMSGGKAGKAIMGAFLVAVGVAILTGFDKQVEIAVLKIAPEWLVDLTTRF